MARYAIFAGLLMLVGVGFSAIDSVAQERAVCDGKSDPQGVIVTVDGMVEVRKSSGRTVAASVGEVLCARDQITTGARSRVEFRLTGKNTTTGSSSDSVTIIPSSQSECVELRSGLMSFISSVVGSHCVSTPLIDAGIEGTEVLIAVDRQTGDSFVLVQEGIVSVRDRRASAGQGEKFKLVAASDDLQNAAFATQEQILTRATPKNIPPKFRELLLKPADATDWAIHYPPILFASGVTDPSVREAAALLDAGETGAANALLNAVTLTGRDKASALALQSITAIYKNQTDLGRTLADEAVATDPGLGAAHIAQSYAYQATGQLVDARFSAEAAVAAEPANAYAWARLAELHLVVGAHSDAQDTVIQSLAIAETAHGRTIEGFTALSTNDLEVAEATFRRAIEIDSEAPLPRLGLGLSAIRRGDVAAGRLEIETAVALDPKRASLRTWLGRSYLAEGRPEKAASQLVIAREQDPDDPNAFLFDGLRLYTENRPVEALYALEESRKRGGARAVVRGSRGLGDDASVRSTALGRIYDVLGFEELSLQEAARAVDLDPTSPAAHRFLFNSYRGRPGFEIAQASELFRFQFLSPPSSEPVQPSLAEADLGVLAIPGSTRVTFHEFARLFQTEGISGYASGSVGNNGVFGDEVSLTLLDGNTSVSVGQFHSQTNGFRDNDDVTHDVVTALVKHAPVPELTLTAEARFRSTDEGDRFLRAIDDPFPSILRTASDRALLRFGAHVRPNEQLDLLAVGTYAIRDVTVTEVFDDPFLDITTEEKFSTWNFEAQGVHRFRYGHVTAGGSVTRTTSDGALVDIFGRLAFDADADQHSLYAYGVINPIEDVDLTLGLSYEASKSRFQFVDFGGSDIVDSSQLNPKVGLRAEVIDGVTVRAAYFQSLKKDIVADQTLEPTTIAGFNQFFDDFTQTASDSYGAGIDLRLTDDIWIGAEYLHRDLDTPSFDLDVFGNTIPVTLVGTEKRTRAYVNATINPNWSVAAGIEFIDNETEDPERPDRVETLLVPVSARYFDPSGFFVGAEAIWFNQKSNARDQGLFAQPATDTDESGVIVNAAVGYRLPNNRGRISLEVNNLLDKDFRLQNSLNNSARPSTRPLAEDLSIVGRITLSF